MIKNKYEWSALYRDQVERNIGLISLEEQEKLRTTRIAVLGTGGLGGSLVEQLVRAGCEFITLCDHDTFELSNLNRQICTLDDIGKRKVEVIEQYLLKINPKASIRPYYEVHENIISELLQDISLVCLTLDDPIASILIARECRERNIPMLETWGIPYLFAWWFTAESIDYETCYGFDTHNFSIEQLRKIKSKDVRTNLKFVSQLFQIDDIRSAFNREPGMLDKMLEGEISGRSFAPIIRLNASYLAMTVIYAGILHIKKRVLAPEMVGYDYIRDQPIKVDLHKL
jgi:hypothetical protein